MSQTAVRPVLLFVESNTSGTGHTFVQTARSLGFHPVLATASPAKYRYLREGDAPEVIVLDSADEESLASVIRHRFRGVGRLAGITSSSEYSVALAAALTARFGLPGPDPARVRAARDKSHQREVFSAGGLPTPRFRAVETVHDAARAAREIGFPVVVKPVDGSGSLGVRMCGDISVVRAHAAALLLDSGRKEGPAARVLVESLVEGQEFSVELFSGQVVGVTRKHLGSPPHFVEAGHDFPAALSTDAALHLSETAQRAAALLGLAWGPLHCELRMLDGQAIVIEMNPRLAGGFIPELVRHARGIDLIRETLRLVTGQAPDLAAGRHGHASIRFLFSPSAGRLAAAEGVGEVRAHPAVVDVALYRQPGEDVSAYGDFRDRIGHVLACADDGLVAVEAAERGRAAICIRVEAPAAADAAPAAGGPVAAAVPEGAA